ncbi:MAG: hypothetical protein ACRET6_05005 [Burkholderiales bacterium]
MKSAICWRQAGIHFELCTLHSALGVLMGVEIKLTDKELPISPAMIEFLDHHIAGKAQEATWSDQLSETLVPTEAQQRLQYAQSVADKVLQDPLGRQAIYRAYDLLAAISIGSLQKLKALHERYGSAAAPAEFKVFDRRSRHPDWSARANAAVARVAQVWHSAGRTFPVDEVMEGW